MCEMDFSIAPKRQRATPPPTQNSQDQQKQSFGPEGSRRERSARTEARSADEAPTSIVDDDERNFWEQTSADELSEQAKLEFRAFKRVHIHDVSEFTQAMNRIDGSYFDQFDIQYVRDVRIPFMVPILLPHEYCNYQNTMVELTVYCVGMSQCAELSH
jgi:hypothetical protein